MTFRHIAWQNVRRQWRDFAAYLFATSFSVLVFFVFVSLAYHPQFSDLAASNTRLQSLFFVSAILVGLFSMLFLWYSSSLFFHKRNREVGTYMLLGMKKREAAWILYLESFIVGFVALAVGIALGLLLRRLFLLLLVRMMAMPIELEVQVDARPILTTVAAFVALFAAAGLSGVFGVLRYDLIRLFREEQTGEERPRFAVAQAVLALAAIGAGYVLAARPQPGSVGLQTLGLILLVTVAGTFLLFGGLGYLVVRANKRRLARTADPLGTVSSGQVLFRIRRNAKFLALVAVLNAVAVTSVGTFLTFREERELMFESLEDSAPFDFSFYADSPAEVERLTALASEIAPEQNPEAIYVDAIVAEVPFPYSERGAIDAIISRTDYDRLAAMRGLPAWSQAVETPTGAPGPNDLLLIGRTGATASAVTGRVVQGLPDGRELEIAGVVNELLFSFDRVAGGYTGVVPDGTFTEIASSWRTAESHAGRSGGIVGIGVIDVTDPRSSFAILEALDDALPEEADLTGAVAYMIVVNGVTGILLFIGAFIGIMLVLSNGSIIFFRQLMEAYESRGRFELLSKLGFTRKDIRSTILRGQLSLFGVPYLVGLVHALFALLMLANLININTINAHIAISAIYALVYAGYVLVNARVYERIVLPAAPSR